MSKLAARFSFALALARDSADAAATCAAGYTAQTGAGVDKLFCAGDITSCSTDPKCCKAPAPAKTCLSEKATITCDAPEANRLDSTTVGASAAATKAVCCSGKATCDAATCPAGHEKDAANKDEVCAGVAACLTANSKSCCKAKAGTCAFWKNAAVANRCPSGKHEVDGATVGADADKCCASDVMCSTHVCPLDFELITANAATKCAMGLCSNDQCCKCKATTCCGATVTCGANKYHDKNTAVFGSDAECCWDQARCGDVAANSATVAAPTFSAMLAILVYGAAK